MRQLSRVGALLGSATAIVLVEGFDLPRGQNPTSPRPRPNAVVVVAAAAESVVDDTTGPIVSVATAPSSPSLGENVLERIDALEKKIATASTNARPRVDEISTKIDALRAEIVAKSSRSVVLREEILANVVDESRKKIATRSTVAESTVPVAVAAAAVPLVAAVAVRSSRARRARIEAEKAAAAAREERSRSDARAETSVARRATDAALERATRLRADVADLLLSIAASDDRRGTREVTGARLRAAELEDAVVDASSRIRRSVARTSRDHDADASNTIGGGIVAVGAASLVAGATAANREPNTDDGKGAKVATPTTNNIVKPYVQKTTSDPPTALDGPTTTIAPPTPSPISSVLPDATQTTTTTDDVQRTRIDVAPPSFVDLGAVAFAGLVSLRSALVGSRIDREMALTTEENGRVRADLDDAWRRATTEAARALDDSDVGVDEA